MASLSVTRGDTLPIIVNIDSNGEPYELEEGDIITFTVKKTTDINDAVLIQKQMDKNTGLYCELTPQDTRLPYGKYKYYPKGVHKKCMICGCDIVSDGVGGWQKINLENLKMKKTF